MHEATAVGMESRAETQPVERSAGKRIWIDLDNSPHVPFFLPIIRELEALGYNVVITARDCAQTLEMAKRADLNPIRVGKHFGKHTLPKLAALAIRTCQLAPMILRQRPALAVSHGSRSQFALAAGLGIPNITIMDYEHVRWVRVPKCSWIMAPECIPASAFLALGVLPDHLLRYPGIKEDVYTPSFTPDPSFKTALGIENDDLIVTVRPPAGEAHYHNPESDMLLETTLQILSGRTDTRTVLLPRTTKQGEALRHAWQPAFDTGRFIIPTRVIDGLNLIWHSDLVISGGGTMNREAAALGVPVYSIFRGPIGAIDKQLASEGRLVLLENADDVRGKLRFSRRDRRRSLIVPRSAALKAVVENIVKVAGRQ